jgi:RND family efflux transporter MFP subunit
MKTNKNVLIVGGIAIVLVILAVFKLMTNKKNVEDKIYIPEVGAAVLVEVDHPKWFTFENEFNYLGVFEAFRQNTIGAEGGGKVIAMNVEEGDKLGKGALIAKLDDEMIRLQIENLEVSIEGQKNDDQRYSTLSIQNAVPAVQSEKAKLGIKASMVQKKQLEKQLRACTIRAPFAGVVSKRYIDLGSVIGSGSPVIEITDISSLKLTISVPERDINKFKVNDKVSIKADAFSDNVAGKVTNIAVQADKSHNFKIQILLKNINQQLRAGMYGYAVLQSDQKITSISVPRKALVGSLKNPQVFVVRNGKVKLVSFTTGLSEGDLLEVRSGLSVNDIIVVKGQINLKDNSNVKISK